MTTVFPSHRARFSTQTVTKAERLIRAERIVADRDYPGTVYWAEGSAGNWYRIQIEDAQRPSWIACTCRHGQTSGLGNARCYHAVAALMMLREDRQSLVEGKTR